VSTPQKPYSREQLSGLAVALRRVLEPAFDADTAAPGFVGIGPSAGQCAAVALIAYEDLGGKLVSAKVDGQSHWFNRFLVEGGWVDVDLTGDQFGRPAIQWGDAGTLYEATRERGLAEVNQETADRSRRLRTRAALGGP
jgi:hypothetical protein